VPRQCSQGDDPHGPTPCDLIPTLLCRQILLASPTRWRCPTGTVGTPRGPGRLARRRGGDRVHSPHPSELARRWGSQVTLAVPIDGASGAPPQSDEVGGGGGIAGPKPQLYACSHRRGDPHPVRRVEVRPAIRLRPRQWLPLAGRVLRPPTGGQPEIASGGGESKPRPSRRPGRYMRSKLALVLCRVDD
jgi:hypothetical protein